jgi:hypothetical protein
VGVALPRAIPSEWAGLQEGVTDGEVNNWRGPFQRARSALHGVSHAAYRSALVTPTDARTLIEREVIEVGEAYRRGGDSEGLIWIRPPASSGALSVPWQVYHPSGELRASVILPEPLEIFEIGVDYILGRELDAGAGVPLLRQYRLRRAAAP